MLPLPFSLQAAWGDFSDIYCGNMAKFLEVNLTILRGHPITGSPGSFSLSDLTTLRLQQFIKDGPGFPTPVPVPAGFPLPASALGPDSVCSPSASCLSSPGGSSVTPVPSPHTDPRWTVDFSVCLTFYLENGVATSKFLRVELETRHSSALFKNLEYLEHFNILLITFL